MGATSNFVATFLRDLDWCFAVEEVEELRKKAPRNIELLWQHRVKSQKSLEQKLRSCISHYNDESANVADFKDLVAGKILLAHWKDFQHKEEVVKESSTFETQIQHPKLDHYAISFQRRFRGYDGLHLYVKPPGDKKRQSCDPTISNHDRFCVEFYDIET